MRLEVFGSIQIGERALPNIIEGGQDIVAVTQNQYDKTGSEFF